MPHLTKISTSTTASDILSADTTSPSSLDDYPSRLRTLSIQPTRSILKDTGPISPTAVTGFNFAEQPTSPKYKTRIPTGAHPSQSPTMKEQDWDAQSIRSTKSTKSIKSLKSWRSKSVSKEDAKRKTQFYEDQFAYKDDWTTHTVDQARAISPIIAELRTNVIVRGLTP
jgi:hypothetical protein